MIERLHPLYAGHDRFALVVTGTSRRRVLRASLGGRHQAEATAVSAAEFARALADEEIPEPGAWLPEQVLSPDRFFNAISDAGYRPVLDPVNLPSRGFHRPFTPPEACWWR